MVLILALIAAGCSGDADPTPPPTEQTGPIDTSIELLGTDTLMFRPEEVSALTGRLSVSLTSGSSVRHNVVIEGVDDEDVVVEAAPGETATGFVALEPGAYVFYCSIPGHRIAGMEGTLQVEDDQ